MFTGVVVLVWGSVVIRSWPIALLGVLHLLSFAIDALVLGAMVSFRLQYVSIPTCIFALSMIPLIVRVTTMRLIIDIGSAIGIALGFAVAILCASCVVTALTCVVPKLPGVLLCGKTAADIEDQRADSFV